MSLTIFDLIVIVGSLGLFVYGIKTLSEGSQRIAASWIRSILSNFTTTKFSGIINGFLTTVITQSSSATTIMMVSFVNAGLLNLRQAIGVIMGANIGTTTTAVLIAFFGFSAYGPGNWALPLIALGLPLLFANNPRVKSLADLLFGFGIFILGISALKAAIPNADAVPDVAQLIHNVGVNSFWMFLLFVALGTLFTVILQSSSASLVLTLVLAGNGLLGFEQAAAIVLGENVGTTVTANLAANIGNVHAKRAARAHSIFNVFGVLIMLIFFPLFLKGIDSLTHLLTGESPLNSPVTSSAYRQSAPWGITLFHVGFNLLNTLVFVWLTDFVAKLVTRLVPGTGKIDEEYNLEFIERGPMGTPELSLLEARKEVAKLGKLTQKIIVYFDELFTSKDVKFVNKRMGKIKKYENITDRVEVEIANYLMRVSRGELTSDSSERVRMMLSVISELERIGDLFYQMSLTMERKMSERIYFTPEQRNSIETMLNMLHEAGKVMNEYLDTDNAELLPVAKELKRNIMRYKESVGKEHYKSIEKGDYNIRSGLVYNDLLNACEKVGENITNVSERLSGKNVLV